jgi:chemotaxis protein CheX
VLGLPVWPDAGAPASMNEEDSLTGCVRITGRWEGAVTLHCSAAMLREIVGRLFAVAPHEATLEQLHDTLGELTNITGGNVKALLPGPSSMGLPYVADGAAVYDVRSRPLAQTVFRCQGCVFTITVLERLPDLVSREAIGAA